MIDSEFHVQLNGVKYRLAEDAEGTHYDKKRQPLRAQSAGVVQGDSGKFQLRPDILEWRQTDWGGGEGYVVYKPDNSDRYRVGHNIDVFKKPGSIQLSEKSANTKDSGGSSDFAVYSILVTAGEKLFAVDASAATFGVYEWNAGAEKWGTLTANASDTNGPALGNNAAGSPKFLYYAEDISGNNDIWQYDHVAGTFALFHTTGKSVFCFAPSLVRKYLLTAESTPTGVTVKERDTTATLPVAGTDIYEVEGGGGALSSSLRPQMTTGANAVYMITHVRKSEAVLHKITPTTAAGGGSGEEVFRLPGFQADALWYQFGFVYISGRMGANIVVVYYDETNETFGVLSDLQERTGVHMASSLAWWTATTEGVQGFIAAFASLTGPDNEDDQVTIIKSSQVTGGVASGTVHDPGAVLRNGVNPSLVWFDGELFWVDDITAAPRIVRFHKDEVTTGTGVMETSVIDFDITDDKVLLSLKLVTEPLPAATQVVVKYQLDQDGTWISVGTHDTDSATEIEFVISNSTTTRTFRNLQLRLELTGTANLTPVVSSLRVFATVAKGVRFWNLILDCSDEMGELQGRAWDGEKLIDNIETAGDSGDVVAFKDGYHSLRPNDFNAHDVIVDDYDIVMDRPGEGAAHVRLREVI